MRVVLQAGHSARFAPFAAGGGGAPGEADWTGRLAALLAQRLEAAGVEVECVGAWLVSIGGVMREVAHPPIVEAPADLFVALHYDAPQLVRGQWDTTGCFADCSPTDPQPRSAEFAALWNTVYPRLTGIQLDEYRGVNNPNTDHYYAWAALAAETPAVLIEHGCGSLVPVGAYPAGGDAAYLHDHIEAVADADFQAIGAFLGLFEEEEDDDMATLTDTQRAILDTCAGLNWNAQSIADAVNKLGAYENDIIPKLRAEVAGLTEQLNAAPIRTADDIEAVTIRRRGGATQEVT